MSLSTQFTENVATGTKATTDCAAQIREDWQTVRAMIGPDSTLSKQLENHSSSCQNLHQKVVAIEPTLNALQVSVDTLTAAEAGLVHDLKDFEEKLANALVPTNQPGLEKELSTKFAENTQLQLQVQRLSLEKDAVQGELHAKSTETDNIRLSFVDMSRKHQEAENRIQQLESDKLTLQSQVALAAQQAAEERDKSITSTEQTKAQFERQFQELQQEKDNLQRGTDELISQLGGVRDSLVGIIQPVVIPC